MKSLLKYFFGACSFFFMACTVFAQNDSSASLADKYFKQGDSLILISKRIASIPYFEKALPIYQKEKNWNKVAEAYNRISKSYWLDFDLEKGRYYADKALETTELLESTNVEERAEAYSNIGFIYVYQSDMEQGLSYLEKAFKLRLEHLGPDHMEIAGSYRDLAYVYDELQDYSKAVEYLEKAIVILKRELPETKPILGDIYYNLAGAYRNLRQFSKAQLYFDKVMIMEVEKPVIDSILIGYIYTSYGNIHNDKEEHMLALKSYRQSLNIFNRRMSQYSFEKLLTHVNLATTYSILEKPDSALHHYNKGLSIGKAVLGGSHRYIVDIYISLAKHFNRVHDYDNGLESGEKALALGLHALGGKNGKIVECHNIIARSYYFDGKYEKALESYDRALSLLDEITPIKLDDESVVSFPFYHGTLLSSLNGKAACFRAQYQKDGDLKALNNAIANYEQAATFIERIRSTVYHYEDNVSMTGEGQYSYAGLAGLNLSLYERGNDVSYLEKSFEYSEVNRSSTLKGLLAVNNSNSYSGLPEEMQDLEFDLKKQIADIRSQARQSKENGVASNDDQMIAYRQQLFNLGASYDSLVAVMRSEYPKYYRLKHENKVISVSEIQSSLGSQTALVEYLREDSVTYAYIITPTDFNVEKLNTLNLKDNIQVFKDAILSQDVARYKSKGIQLYFDLIAPIKPLLNVQELIIIPDGELWDLNFDLLLSGNPKEGSERKLPYLLRDYAINYASSASLLFDSVDNSDKEDILSQCLAFSYLDSASMRDGDGIELATLRNATERDLPGTRKEIKAISNIVDGVYYYGDQAVESNFKENASRYAIVHLALHGVVDNQNPDNSRLFFNDDNDSIQDNLLYSQELFAMNIPAQLTVLSACNTGTGKIARGEGIMSLGNAFQYAGTKSLLLSNWEVSDYSAPKIMENFYINLQKGMNKARALQQAKLTYLEEQKDPATISPYYWAGFYILGDKSAIELDRADKGFPWLWTIISLVLVISLSTYIVSKRG